ncbi:MAG: peptidoglycan DD-metalloendopeptidase family protein [Asticcacaulis sp.]|nr:peptidoglycan DD-metalloendopeptidase family protein [Asticcacaulis sp.]
MGGISLSTALVVLLVLPLAWSIAVAGGWRALNATGRLPDDGTEKLWLLILVLPVAIGLACLTLAPLFHVDVPLPMLPLTDKGGDIAGLAMAPGEGALRPSIDWIRLAVIAVLSLYVLGALALGLRLAVAQVRLGRLVARAETSVELGHGVLVTTAAVPPLVWGRFVLLPLCLTNLFEARRLELILRHEREHMRRGDGHWFALLAWIDVVFWFNPVIRGQTRRCRLAAELACDAGVLSALPEMRGVYADTLVKALKHTAGNTLSISTQSGVPAVFSPEQSGDYRMRLREIMHPPAHRRKSGLWLCAAAAVLAVPLALGQYAWSQGTPVTPVASAAPLLTTAPVDGPVTSGFGERIDPRTHEKAFHSGVDFKAALGTPVRAAGDGVVMTVDYKQYGMGWVVEIDHGGGLKTRCAHLSPGVTVKVGDRVKAGDVIAASGNSGISTGPHLHFEVWQNGEAIDPQTVLTLPTAG